MAAGGEFGIGNAGSIELSKALLVNSVLQKLCLSGTCGSVHSRGCVGECGAV